MKDIRDKLSFMSCLKSNDIAFDYTYHVVYGIGFTCVFDLSFFQVCCLSLSFLNTHLRNYKDTNPSMRAPSPFKFQIDHQSKAPGPC
jgi:hypothetical protein